MLYNEGNRIRGFTLIELLVVIAIIGILSAVVMAAIGTAREKARDSTRISDLKNLKMALVLYFDTTQTFPENEIGIPDAQQLAGATVSSALVSAFLPVVPMDPLTVTRNAGSQYLYEGLLDQTTDCPGPNGCTSYALGATMERSNNSVLDSDTNEDVITTAFRGLGIENCDGGATPGTDGVDETCYSIAP